MTNWPASPDQMDNSLHDDDGFKTLIILFGIVLKMIGHGDDSVCLSAEAFREGGLAMIDPPVMSMT